MRALAAIFVLASQFTAPAFFDGLAFRMNEAGDLDAM